MTGFPLEELRAGFLSCGIPKHMQAGLEAYVIDRRRPGQFLVALLENDLHEAVVRADDENRYMLRDWCTLLFNFTPSPCWGSPAKVAAWLEAPRG